ncbi:MAG: leucine-rich repeat protein [Eubacterium sp.]
MKRFTSLLLSVVMLLSITAGLSFSASAATPTIALGESRNPNIKIAGRSVTFEFTPEKDVTAVFYTLAVGKDSCVDLYDADMNYLDDSDDDGVGNNAKLIYDFTGGETYYFDVYFYYGKETGYIPCYLDEYVSGATSTYYYEFYGDQTVIYYNYEVGKELPENLVITPTMSGRPVTILGDGAFYGLDYIKSVTIPDSVKYIDESAFENCYDLTTVNFGKGVRYIGNYAFYDTSLESVTLPESLEAIDWGAFEYTYIKNVTIPKNVSFIKCTAFGYSDLQAYNVVADNPYYKSVNGVLFSKDGKTIVSYPCSRYEVSGAYYSVPKGTEAIGEDAFYQADLAALELPSTLKYIREYAFDKASIGVINIPASVELISEDAFYNSSCGVRFLGTECEIEDDAFYNYKGAIALHKASKIEESIKAQGIEYTGSGSDRFYMYFCEENGKEHDYNPAYNPVFSTGGYDFYMCANCGEYYKELAVTGVDIVSAAKNSLTLKCDVTPGAAGYHIIVKDEANKEVARTKIYSRTGTISGLDPTSVYTVYFRAFNSKGAYITPWTDGIDFCTAPEKVTGLKTSARGANGVNLTLSWNEVEGAEAYLIYAYNQPEDRWTYLTYSETNKFVDEYVTPGYEYTYMVTAVFGGAESEPSDALHTCAACETMEAPSVNAVKDTVINVDWQIVGSHGYVVMWSKDSSFSTDTSYKYITGHSVDNCTITVPSDADQYYVRVRAWRNWYGGKVYGSWSEGAKSGDAAVKVTGLVTSARGANGVNLTISWDAQENADSYNVYAYNKPADSWTLLENVTTNKYIGATTPGYEYTYRVAAVKDGVEGLPSDTLYTCAACETMAAPTVEKNGSQILANWKLVGSHGYVVMWSTDPTFSTGVSYKYITGHSVDSYTITGIDASQTYYVRVRAWRNWDGGKVYGSWSDATQA